MNNFKEAFILKKIFALFLIILGVLGIVLPVLPGWIFIISGWAILSRRSKSLSKRYVK